MRFTSEPAEHFRFIRGSKRLHLSASKVHHASPYGILTGGRRLKPALISDFLLRTGANPGAASYLTSTSAICTALSAAPLRSWSPETQKQRPLSNAQSRRSRPTSQLYFSAVKSGIG